MTIRKHFSGIKTCGCPCILFQKDYIENVGNEPVSIAQNASTLTADTLESWNGRRNRLNAKTLETRADELVVVAASLSSKAPHSRGTMAKPLLLFAISKGHKKSKEAAEFYSTS